MRINPKGVEKINIFKKGVNLSKVYKGSYNKIDYNISKSRVIIFEDGNIICNITNVKDIERSDTSLNIYIKY